MFRYAYTGPGEVFPEPPIARFLENGAEVVVEQIVEHPRLELVEGPDLSAFWLEPVEIPPAIPEPKVVMPSSSDMASIVPQTAPEPVPEPTDA